MILVVGSTGVLGGMITRRLLEQGQPVRILVRPHADYQPLVAAGAEPVLGDLKDPASLAAACAGVDTVITTANSGMRGGEDTVETVDLQGNRNLIDAAKAAGVRQFVFVSTVHADPNSPAPIFQAKAATEEYLRASGLPYTIVAPHSFLEFMPYAVVVQPALAGEPVRLVGEGRRRHAYTSLGDAAALTVAMIDHPAARNQRLLLTGPQAVTWYDLVALTEQAVGHSIPVETVLPGVPFPGMHEIVYGALVGHEYFDLPMDSNDLARTFGITLTSPEEFVRRSVEAAAVPAG